MAGVAEEDEPSRDGLTINVLPPGTRRQIRPLVGLTPGTRLGVYEVTAQIGEGGMG